jgi:hypothetical protein
LLLIQARLEDSSSMYGCFACPAGIDRGPNA